MSRRTAWIGAWGALLVCSAVGGARADAPHSELLGRRNPLRSLVPSPLDARERERLHVEQTLIRGLSLLPQVEQVEVSLSWAPSTGLSLAPPASRAAVVLRCAGHGPSDAQVRALVRRLAPTLDPQRISIMRVEQPHRPAPAVSLTAVGPFQVRADSAPALRLLMAASLAANALLAGAWLARGLRRRRAGQSGS